MTRKPSLIDVEGASAAGRNEKINPHLVALVARASGTIAVVQARSTVDARLARAENAVSGLIGGNTYFTDQLAEALPEAGPLRQPGELWQPKLQMGPYKRGLNVDLVYQRIGGNAVATPLFRVRLNATTGEALVRCYESAPIGGPDTDVVGVHHMLEALDFDVQEIQAANLIEYPASPVAAGTLISSS